MPEAHTSPASDPDSVPPPEPAAEVDRVEPIRLPLLPRRRRPWLVVEVDGSAACYGGLVWALREAARRDATVVAVAVLGDEGPTPFDTTPRFRSTEHAAAYDRVEAQLLRAIAETGIHGRSRTAVLDRIVFEALTAARQGADLVVVGPHHKALLRHAVPRLPGRGLARGA